jgi:two-component system sensor histidine kinase PilS (NtrC family)
MAPEGGGVSHDNRAGVAASTKAGGIRRRIRSLTAFRVFLVTVLLGSFFVFRIGFGFFPYPASVLYLIVSLYALSIVYAVVIGKVPDVPLAYVQLFLDALAVVLLVMATGGIQSWFSYLLLINVMVAAIVLGRRAAFVVATFGTLLYGVGLDLQYYGILPVPFDHELMERDFLYRIFLHITGLYLIAYLSGHLVGRIERSGVEFEELSFFNREVIEGSPSGILTTDLAGRIAIFNRAAERITGMERARVFGRHVSMVFPFLQGDLARTERTEAVVDLPSGAGRTMGIKASVLTDTGGLRRGYIVVFEDMTAIKGLEREIKHKEQLAAVGELTARIAHEIRNPLASLRGSMEMLREDARIPEEKRARLMDIALHEMDRLNLTLTDFLIYARPKPIEPREVDLNHVLGEVVDMLRNHSSAPVDIRASLDGPLMAWADADRMREVFWNLGINALDAMGDAGGVLEVSTSIADDEVRVVFSDTGPGVSLADRERIFYPFFTTKGRGTGLGLSTAGRVAEEHGGQIVVDRAPGGGARFTVILPRGIS